jgi:hypothetical protein
VSPQALQEFILISYHRQDLTYEMSKLFGLETIPVKQPSACDCDVVKQKFIVRNHNPDQMFSKFRT